MDVTHEVLPEGESTEKWAFRNPGFMGTVRQLIRCARCGDYVKGGKNDPRHFIDILKPTFHTLCDDCHNALPD